MKSPLMNRNFLLLWLGQAVSQIGNGAGFIATMWWIQSTTGSAIALGTLALIQTLVAVILSPFAGVVVDRYNRKLLIVVTDLIRGVVYGVFALHAFRGTLSLPILYGGAAINSACSAFFNPAVGAAIPQLVPSGHLGKANSLRQMTDQLATVFSYALGGVLVAAIGVPMLLLLDSVSFLLSALSEMFISLDKVAAKGKLTAKSFVMDLRSGVLSAKSTGALFPLLQVLVFVNFCFVPFFLLLPKYVAHHLKAGSAVYGYITSSQMAGMLVGTVLVLTLGTVDRYPWIMRWGIAVQAAGFIVSPLLPTTYWWLQLLIYGLFGALNSMINITCFTTLQRKVQQEHLGKILSLVSAMTLAAQPVASYLSGYLAERISLTAIFMVAGALGVLSNFRLMSIPGVEALLDMETQHKQAMTA